MGFDGAKMALYLGADLVVILRDEKPGLPFAGYWDLPGGGAELGETPLQCARRECQEELGLIVPEDHITWARPFQEGSSTRWFFVAHLDAQQAKRIKFGDEGQCWQMMTEADFLEHPKVVPDFQKRLKVWIAERD